MKEYLKKIFYAASEKIPELAYINHVIDVPKQKEHGDLSSNSAMLLSKILKKNPRQIAQQIIEILDVDPKVIYKTEIAGPGFINFFFTPEYIAEIIKIITSEYLRYFLRISGVMSPIFVKKYTIIMRLLLHIMSCLQACPLHIQPLLN